MILRTRQQTVARTVRALANTACKPPTARVRMQSRVHSCTYPTVTSSRTYTTRPPTTPSASDSKADAVTTPASPPRSLRSQLDPEPFPAQDARPKRKRKTGTVILCAAFLLLGLTAGKWVTYVIAPPALPEPGSTSDIQMMKYIQSQGKKLAIVQRLEADAEWKSWDAYEAFNDEERKHRITTGPLGGARGIGSFQRIFRNARTGECVSVVWIGGALAGFPGVCHGGMIATVLDESLGRCAISSFPGRTGVTANLELKYLAPVVTNSFYVVRCTPDAGPGGVGSTDRKAWVRGRWEGVDGAVFVEAKALFVVPRNVTLRSLEEF